MQGSKRKSDGSSAETASDSENRAPGGGGSKAPAKNAAASAAATGGDKRLKAAKGGSSRAAAAAGGKAPAAVIALDSDEELEVIAAAIPESAHFPHARSECKLKPFRRGESSNAAVCGNCFCFVCDVKAEQCKRWREDHCHAVSTDETWRKRRETARLAATLKAQMSGKAPRAGQAPASAAASAASSAAASAGAAQGADLEITHVRERDEPGWTRLPGPIAVSIPHQGSASARRLPATGASARELFTLYAGPRPPMPAGGFEALPDRAAKVREALRCLATLEQLGYGKGRAEEASGPAGARHFRLTVLLNFGGYRAVLESPAPPPEVEPVMWLVLEHLRGTLPPERRAALDAAARPESTALSLPASAPPPFDVAALVRSLEMGEEDGPLLEEGAAEAAGLALRLRPYQRQAVRFMLDRERAGEGLLERLWARIPLPAPQRGSLFYFPLAARLRTSEPPFARGGFNCEEMGLGKTVEVIALALLNPAPTGRALKEPCCQEAAAAGLVRSRGTLVVAPTTLLEQWRREVAKAAPEGPKVLFWHGADRRKQPALVADHDFVITSYSLLASGTVPGPLHKIAWHRVVLDESHAVRAAGRQTGDAARRLHSHLRWCCSGTPFATRAYDVVGQLHFLAMDPLGEVSTFDAAIGRHFDARDPRGPARLLGVLRGATVRHSKEQAFRGERLVVLPPRTVEVCRVTLTPDEKTLYQHLEAAAAARHRALLKETLRPPSGLLADLLLPLRQVCSHAGLVPHRRLHAASRWQTFAPSQNTGGAKTKRTPADEEAEEAAEAEAAAAVPVAVQDAHERAGAAPESSTTALALRHLKALREEDPGAKAVVFSEFPGTLERFAASLQRAGLRHSRLAGNMDQRARARSLEQFLTDESVVALLAPLSIGSAGLNLTAASTVMLLEPPLNPRDEAQAIGRVHRIGQTRPVLARKYVCEGTVEERLQALHHKRHADVDTTAPELVKEPEEAGAGAEGEAGAGGLEAALALAGPEGEVEREAGGEQADPAQVGGVEAEDFAALFAAAAGRKGLL